MKKLKLLMILPFCCACSSSVKEAYSGYLYNEKNPMKNAKVIEQTTNNFTYTNEKGYFNLKRSDPNKINDLVIESFDKQLDTVKLLRGASAGSELKYVFLSNISDTLDINRERVFKKQSSTLGK